MPHLFVKDDGSWAVIPLQGQAFRLNPRPYQALSGKELDHNAGSGSGVFVRRIEAEIEQWMLLSGIEQEVHVNGRRLNEGLRLLADRDEIRVASSGTYFYSTETLPSVQTFPGPDSACMRCSGELRSGQPAFRCPHCTVWHHEEPGRACWSDIDACANCRRSTAMNAGFHWSPEDL